MLSLARQCEISRVPSASKFLRLFCSTYISPTDNNEPKKDEFRVLEILPKKVEVKKTTRKVINVPESREKSMPVDQDWPSVWPGPRTFQPHTVPLPLRQGYVEGPKERRPNKYANAELLKIPNFLHLTPPAVKRHCEAIKKFCTKWPEELKRDTDCEKYFPVEIISSDYCYSSPTIREPLARIVSLRIKVSNLKLDKHAKDKLFRLVKDRYDPETDILTIVADRCPTKRQNLEYVQYLLTAVYHEACRMEPWEKLKAMEDEELFNWDKSKSRENVVSTHNWPEKPKDYEYVSIPAVPQLKHAVEELVNEGEDDNALEKYKVAVLGFLKLQPTIRV